MQNDFYVRTRYYYKRDTAEVSIRSTNIPNLKTFHFHLIWISNIKCIFNCVVYLNSARIVLLTTPKRKRSKQLTKTRRMLQKKLIRTNSNKPVQLVYEYSIKLILFE